MPDAFVCSTYFVKTWCNAQDQIQKTTVLVLFLSICLPSNLAPQAFSFTLSKKSQHV